MEVRFKNITKGYSSQEKFVVIAAAGPGKDIIYRVLIFPVAKGESLEEHTSLIPEAMEIVAKEFVGSNYRIWLEGVGYISNREAHWGSNRPWMFLADTLMMFIKLHLR